MAFMAFNAIHKELSVDRIVMMAPDQHNVNIYAFFK